MTKSLCRRAAASDIKRCILQKHRQECLCHIILPYLRKCCYSRERVWHRPQLSKLAGVRSSSRCKSLKTLEATENCEPTPFSRNRMLSKLERSQYSTVVRRSVPEIKLGSRLSLYLGDDGSARAIEMLSKLACRKPNLDNCGLCHTRSRE